MARELVLRLDITQERRQLSDEELGLRKRMKISHPPTQRRGCQHCVFPPNRKGPQEEELHPIATVAGHVLAEHADMEKALHDHFCAVFGTVADGGMTLNF